MRVLDVMQRPVVMCTADTSLAAATRLLKQNSCGCLPVAGEGGNVIGMITDRDISVALGTRDERPSQIPVWEVMRHSLFTCTPDEDIHCALKTIRRQKIRRLPVVNAEGAAIGILSIDDIVRKARKNAGRDGVSFEDAVNTYRAVCTKVLPGFAREVVAA